MSEQAKPQLDKFKELACNLEAAEDDPRFEEAARELAPNAAAVAADAKVCPECGHVFQGNGWDGIDAHWRSKHSGVMPYEDAWPLLQRGTYSRATET